MHTRLLDAEQRVIVAVRGEHENRKARNHLEYAVRHVEAVHVGKRKVQDHRIGPVLEDQFDGLDARICLADNGITEFRAADLPDHIPNHQMVFDDYDFHVKTMG